jgi:3-oxoacyl-[acyl-carrier-protein] synthase II
MHHRAEHALTIPPASDATFLLFLRCAPMSSVRPSIVMTGIGVIGAAGIGAQALWDALNASRSGVQPPTRFHMDGFACKLAAEIPNFSAKDYMPKAYRKAIKVMARDIEIAVACAHFATLDAGLLTRAAEGAAPTYAPERVGCQIGAGLISAETTELSAALATAVTHRDDAQVKARAGFDLRAWGTIATAETPAPARGMENLQPLWMLKYLPNMLACHVTIIHGFEGPSNTITCSEASGLLSIGESARVIERGSADACISGSAESRTNLMATARMTLAARLASCEASDAAHAASQQAAVRPFAANASGSVPGEGGGLVVLERESTATARGARICCRVLGFGSAHAVAPLTASSGGAEKTARVRALVNAMRAALKDANIIPDEIDLCLPQGLGVAASDEVELAAIETVFGSRQVPVLALGHLLGDTGAGNGGLQAAIAGLILQHQSVPPALLATHLGKRPIPAGLGRVLVFGSSLAGQQAALVFGRA